MTDTKWTDLSTMNPEFKAVRPLTIRASHQACNSRQHIVTPRRASPSPSSPGPFLPFLPTTNSKTQYVDAGGPIPSLSAFGADMPALRAALLSAPKPLIPGVNIPESMDGVEKTRISIPVRDGASIGAAVYRPTSGTGKGRPLVVALHGGGWCVGAPEFEEVNCVHAVQKHGAVAVSLDYRLAPEHPFPTPVHDCWDALRWLAANASPSSPHVVAADPAGGNMAVVLALLARDEKLAPPLTGVSASIPAVVLPGGGEPGEANCLPEKYRADYRSYEQNKKAPGLDVEGVGFLLGNYNPDRSSHLFAPLNWPTGHKGLPPFFIQVCGLDMLRDEALIYERLLRTECGVKTRLVVYPGLPHSFWSFYPQLEVSRKAVGEVVEGFGWLLGKK
ncbi:ab hydrolase superfamily protein [Diplodia corticola]|uniref:Ab hydrolase superfamily protein n=1 Tax=Diplodia corticola TaxID=236234 RepID=A0A1J9QL31_9PEZI|nr:ab hydrolase superfamily protein [Diplodia corticola]OJD29176.1 ab hydrolase superfamily protein [Diplodia corticola]